MKTPHMNRNGGMMDLDPQELFGAMLEAYNRGDWVEVLPDLPMPDEKKPVRRGRPKNTEE